ncbi:hypothetical protein GCM10022419_105830 [Nonomuraea rosea]|uniref:Uncharacterized protein n=1 Tax=Nonomuraea rosea TaxID=638574 RepID=A0ABP6ZCT6_9ACTN
MHGRDPPIGEEFAGEEFVGPLHLEDCTWPATCPRTPAGGLDLPSLLSRIDLSHILARTPRPRPSDA